MVGVGVHSAQRRVCWGHDVRNRLHTCMVWERHGVCCVRCNRKRGEIVLESQGSYFSVPGISGDSLIQDTCACFHEWRHARCNSGRQLQLYSGANKSALGDWRGHRIRKAYEFWSHGVDTELGRIENSGVCRSRNQWGTFQGHRRMSRPTRGHGSTCMQRGGMDRRRRFSRLNLGVGPTFYTSLLDGGGVVGLGLHRAAEASGGVGTW